MLSEIGEEGQKKILKARVLVVGVGGLGSPISLYLSAVGIGHLGIIDSDVVDISNLQRQIIHSTDTINMPKVVSAKQAINRLNPDVEVVAYQERLTDENAIKIFDQYDIIVDACDNLQARYVINDACVECDKPFVHGSIFQFEGIATVFFPKQGPCYRCLYPTPPPENMMPSPMDRGLLGVLPGVIGTIEATEALKLILGIGDSLKDRLLTYNALEMSFEIFEIKTNPDCEKHIRTFDMQLKQKLLTELEEYFGDDIKRIEHAKEVLQFAEKLLANEKVDPNIIIPASILHDVGINIAEEKYGSSAGHYQEKEGPPIAREILSKTGFDEKAIEEICEIIAHHHSPDEIDTQNFKVLYDADWLVNIKEIAEKREKDKLANFIKKTFLTDSGRKLAEEIYL